MLIIAITGMPGAGKSTAAKALADSGLKRVVMGDVIREETKRRGLPPDDENTGKVMKDLRERYGPGAVAELCILAIREMNASVVVVDGIRSTAEVEVFRKAGNVMLLAIQASRRRRFELLKARARSDDPVTIEKFDRRDERELSVGLGEVIAVADEVLPNEHGTQEELAQRAVEVVKNWVVSVGG